MHGHGQPLAARAPHDFFHGFLAGLEREAALTILEHEAFEVAEAVVDELTNLAGARARRGLGTGAWTGTVRFAASGRRGLDLIGVATQCADARAQLIEISLKDEIPAAALRNRQRDV